MNNTCLKVTLLEDLNANKQTKNRFTGEFLRNLVLMFTNAQANI